MRLGSIFEAIGASSIGSIGDKPASTPVGRLGNELTVQPGTNLPTSIGERTFTGHALDRMQERGLPPSALKMLSEMVSYPLLMFV